MVIGQAARAGITGVLDDGSNLQWSEALNNTLPRPRTGVAESGCLERRSDTEQPEQPQWDDDCCI